MHFKIAVNVAVAKSQNACMSKHLWVLHVNLLFSGFVFRSFKQAITQCGCKVDFFMTSPLWQTFSSSVKEHWRLIELRENIQQLFDWDETRESRGRRSFEYNFLSALMAKGNIDTARKPRTKREMEEKAEARANKNVIINSIIGSYSWFNHMKIIVFGIRLRVDFVAFSVCVLDRHKNWNLLWRNSINRFENCSETQQNTKVLKDQRFA